MNSTTVLTSPLLKYKGRPVYTPEETALQDCPFPDESEWVEELDQIHSAKR